MKNVRRVIVSLMVWLTCQGAAPADVISTATQPDASIDAAIASVLDVERAGLRGVRERSLARLTRVPQGDPHSLTGYSKAKLAAMPSVKGGEQWACLTEALYFEARGEELTGQFAVAEVIMNRVASSRFPDTVCRVVHQGTGERHRCQFSFYCDGEAEVYSEKDALAQVGKVARIILSGKPLSLTGGATHYHTKAVSPKWSRVFLRTATIGYHHFYREPVRVSRR